LGLPKPNPPLERPFPPELIGYYTGGVPGDGGVRGGRGRRGGEGNPEWSRRSTLDVKVERPWAGVVRYGPTVPSGYGKNVTVCQGWGTGVFAPLWEGGFDEPESAGLKRPV
jgi:hypothetical protein